MVTWVDVGAAMTPRVVELAGLLDEKLPSPEYVADRLAKATGRFEVDMEATPLLRGTGEPIGIKPSRKMTLPVGPVPYLVGTTCAFSVTGWPNTDVPVPSGDVPCGVTVRVVVVGASPTVTVRAGLGPLEARYKPE
jgi:hypothetical protein